jgi:diacylglycerol O-acyltransferase
MITQKSNTAGPFLVDGSEPMSPVDLAWLEMDRRCNPMVVAAVLELDSVPSLARLIDTIATRLERHLRFRQRADDGCRPAVWVTQDSIDHRYHFQVLRSRGVVDAKTLHRMIGRELISELDHSFPLWRLSFIRHGQNRVTVLFRAHHAMADGASLMRLLLKLADGVDSELPIAAPQPAQPTLTRRGPLAFAINGLETLNAQLSGFQAALQQAQQQPLESLRTLARIAAGTAITLRVLALRDHNPAAFRQPLSGERRVDWSAPLPLAPIHDLAKRCSVSLNDLFLSLLAGAFGRYLRETGPVAGDATLRVSIPVDLRSADDGDFGNCFGLVLLDLPIGERDGGRRLRQVARQMRKLKHSQEARAMLMSLQALGQFPVFVEKALVEHVAGKASAVVSNLRGPEAQLSFAGGQLKSAVFWPPQTGAVGIGVSLLSYAGSLTIGLCCDTAVLGDPHRVIEAFMDELGALTVGRSA